MTEPGLKTPPFFGGILGVILTALLACEGNLELIKFYEYLAFHGTITSDSLAYHLKWEDIYTTNTQFAISKCMSINKMGVIGRKLGQFIGRGLGNFAGQKLGKFTGIGAEKGGNIGEDIGGDVLGHLIPFKKGGRVKKTGPILAHKGEFILPKGVAPTKTQKARVFKKKTKSSKPSKRKRK